MTDDTVSSGSRLDKGVLERTWAAEEARLALSSNDRTIWDDLRYTVRPFVYYDKIFIAWHIVKGEPQVKDILTVYGIDASFREGLWVKMRSEVNKREVIVGHKPQRLSGLDVFVWLPFFNELRYVSADWNDPTLPRNLRLAMCCKMRHKYDEVLREGVDYLTELHSFRSRWPQYSSTKF